MKRILYVICILIMILQSGCSYGSSYPDTKMTVKVVDEKGVAIEDARVGIGFEINADGGDGGTKEIAVIGQSNSSGVFTGKANAASVVGFNASKDGYYKSYGEYRFKEKKMGRWEPWNPEVTVVLRKIENPIPMYARLAKIKLPESEKEIGFDLVEYDWVTPYGKGKYSDFTFKIIRKYVSDLEFEGNLTLTFKGDFNGIQSVRENRQYGSQFRLPRFAPEYGYEKKIVKTIKAFPGHSIKDNFGEDTNYIFRIRSEYKDKKLIRAMYGKIQGDIHFDIRRTGTASIGFKYTLNPDYTTNLEFDPNRNLFQGLPSLERVGLD